MKVILGPVMNFGPEGPVEKKRGLERVMNTLGNSKDESRRVMWMAAAVGLSALGMAYHTVREFGYSGLLSLGTGMIPVVSVQVFLFVFWWLSPRARGVAGRVLALTGIFQLIGGAIISVLPLPFLPFQPEQSVGHYTSHLLLGIAQLPLIVIPLRQHQQGRRESS